MLVTLAQLKSYMGGIELTPDQETHVTTVILPGVQQELEVHCNRPLEPVHMRESLTVDERGYIIFTVTPVWKLNFIMNGSTGVMLTLPTPPTAPNDLPPFVVDVGMRNVDKVGSEPAQIVGLPFEYFVGGGLVTSNYWPLTVPNTYEATWVADYVGGWRGYEEQGLDLAILRVAAREVERQFDDTMSIRGATQDTAMDSDPRMKYWDQDELYEWDRLRRRVVL